MAAYGRVGHPGRKNGRTVNERLSCFIGGTAAC